MKRTLVTRITNATMAAIMAVTMVTTVGTGDINASAKQFTCRSNGWVQGVKVNFYNRRNPAYVRLTFTSVRQTTYIRYYNNRNQAVWTGQWNGMACLSRRMYLGTNVYRISAKTNTGTNRIQVDANGNCYLT